MYIKMDGRKVDRQADKQAGRHTDIIACWSLLLGRDAFSDHMQANSSSVRRASMMLAGGVAVKPYPCVSTISILVAYLLQALVVLSYF